MVTFHGIDGIEFDLSVDGYECPAGADNRWDLNWVCLHGVIRHPRGDWSFTDACATTQLVGGFADWLESVHANQAVDDFIFGEPDIAFVFTPGPDAIITVELGWRTVAPWLISEGGQSLTLRFKCADNDLLAAAKDWRLESRKVPPRELPESTG